MTKFACSVCPFNTRHFPCLLRHYRIIHAFQNGFRLTCGIDLCQKSYSNVTSFTRHVKSKHGRFYRANIPTRGVNNYVETDELTADEIELDVTDVQNELGNNMNNGEGLQIEGIDYTRHIAHFLLTIREIKKIPLNCCVLIIQEIQDLFGSCQHDTQKQLSDVLQQNGINKEDIPNYKEIFDNFTKVQLSCDQLNSVKKQNRYFAENFSFVEPEEHVLGYNAKKKSESITYVPILKTLGALLKHDDVMSEVMTGHQRNDGHLGDYCDGHVFQTHPLFSSNQSSLQVQLYTDDFQVVNPLGTRIKKFKILAVYFALGNIPPKYRAKLHTIQLALLCHSSHVRTYGWKAVLQPLLFDLSKLELEGLRVYVNGTMINLLGTVSMVISDNLAAHSLAGLTESFSALRNCRFCTVTKEDMQTEFNLQNLTARSPAVYNTQVNLVAQDPTLSAAYGVKSDSPLNTLKFYHVMGGMPSDISHDLFEGFVCEILQVAINCFVREKFFSLAEFNQAILLFPYASSDKSNKPSTMPEDLSKFRVKQTASQTWCLLRLFSLMMGTKIPRDNQYMSLITDLLDIVDFVCCTEVAKGDIAYLGDLIEAFLPRVFATCEDLSVKPKAHYLIHYAYQMLMYGPLKHCWTMRFEGKHNYFKELAYRTKNRINLCKSLATRHQYMQCFYHDSDNYLTADIDQTQRGNVVPLQILDQEIQNLLNAVGEFENVYQSTSISFDGAQYSTGCAVVLGYKMSIYQFAKIECLFNLGGTVYILVRQLDTTFFDRHFHAYCVQETNIRRLLRPHDLGDPYPLGLYPCPDGSSDRLIVLKYRIPLLEHD